MLGRPASPTLHTFSLSMWQATAQDWSKTVRLGIACYMYKQKGCKQDLSNYCVIMLLSVLSQAVRSLVVLQLSDSNPGQKGLDGCAIFSGDLEPTDGVAGAHVGAGNG